MLKGQLGWKGERGYSAYEIAAQNGYLGTEEQWLATLGTSQNFIVTKVASISTEGQTTISLPEAYSTGCYLDVYINGLKLLASEYTIGTTNITLDYELNAGADIEIVVMKMQSNNLSFNLIYPVGSVYLSVDSSANPASLFGGTWVQLSNVSENIYAWKRTV